MHLLTALFSAIYNFWYSISWAIVTNRLLFVFLFVLLGLVIANLPMRAVKAARPLHLHVLHSLIGILTGLTLSAAIVSASALVHAADARWLPPSQRQTPHVAAPSVPKGPNVPLVGSALGVVTNSVNGGLKDMASGTNAAIHPLFELEIQAKAVQVSSRVIMRYMLVSFLSGVALVVLAAMTYQATQRNYRRRLTRAEKRISMLEDRLDNLLVPQKQ